MRYRKPQLWVLGPATAAVQSCPVKCGPNLDSSGGCSTGRTFSGVTAYDADD
jgi:hypothetical protein